jgi:hypothetical protein
MFASISLVGCSGSSEGEAKAESTDNITLVNLLQAARMESAEVKVIYSTEVPDSCKDKEASLIIGTVSGATNRLVTEDYEDTDDLVDAAGRVGHTVYCERVKRIYLSFIRPGKTKWDEEMILVEDLTPSQKALFDFLNK